MVEVFIAGALVVGISFREYLRHKDSKSVGPTIEEIIKSMSIPSETVRKVNLLSGRVHERLKSESLSRNSRLYLKRLVNHHVPDLLNVAYKSGLNEEMDKEVNESLDALLIKVSEVLIVNYDVAEIKKKIEFLKRL